MTYGKHKVVQVNIDGYKYNDTCRAAKVLEYMCKPVIWLMLKLCPGIGVVANVDISGDFGRAIHVSNSCNCSISNVSFKPLGVEV